MLDSLGAIVCLLNSIDKICSSLVSRSIVIKQLKWNLEDMYIYSNVDLYIWLTATIKVPVLRKVNRKFSSGYEVKIVFGANGLVLMLQKEVTWDTLKWLRENGCPWNRYERIRFEKALQGIKIRKR